MANCPDCDCDPCICDDHCPTCMELLDECTCDLDDLDDDDDSVDLDDTDEFEIGLL